MSHRDHPSADNDRGSPGAPEPLRTNLNDEWARTELMVHGRREWRRIGWLRWARVCAYCGEPAPCGRLRRLGVN